MPARYEKRERTDRSLYKTEETMFRLCVFYSIITPSRMSRVNICRGRSCACPLSIYATILVIFRKQNLIGFDDRGRIRAFSLRCRYSLDPYVFKHEPVDDLELSVSWAEFFRMFNAVNHAAFLKELEGCDGARFRSRKPNETLPFFLLLKKNARPIGEIVEKSFDPWRNPSFVGISIRIPPHNRQDYQLVEVFTQ